MIADPPEPAKKKRNFRHEPEVSDISDSELVRTAMEVMSTSAPTGFYMFHAAQKHQACATKKLTGGDKITMNPPRTAAEMQELGKKR